MNLGFWTTVLCSFIISPMHSTVSSHIILLVHVLNYTLQNIAKLIISSRMWYMGAGIAQ
jgi:hypothetical protein